MKCLETPWLLAWIIANSFCDGRVSMPCFEDFQARSEAWANRHNAASRKLALPPPWERDGIQAEMAVRDYLKTGQAAPPRNANYALGGGDIRP